MAKKQQIKRPEDILDSAFKKAQNLAAQKKSTAKRYSNPRKYLAELKVKTIGDTIISDLRAPFKRMPEIDKLPSFYIHLIDMRVGTENAKNAFGKVKTTLRLVMKLKQDYIKKIRGTDEYTEIAQYVTEFSGRVSSIVKKSGKAIETLISVSYEVGSRDKLNFNIPSVVIAGYPNVGKSTLLEGITKASPKIASYPFTTKKISIGHIGKRDNAIQLVDTPGLFERPAEKRNEIEKEAMLALKYLASGIIFIFDVSETCGYSIEDQEKLYAAMKKQFKVPFLLLVTKKDLRVHAKGLKKIKGALSINALDKDDLNKVIVEVQNMPLNRFSA